MKLITLRNGWEIELRPPLKNKNEEIAATPENQQKDKEKEGVAALIFKQKIPYLARLKKDQLDDQFRKFLELYKQLHINIPIAEGLAQMSRYAKFLKDLLTNKRKTEEIAIMVLDARCSAILQKSLPNKMKDLGSFTILCSIGGLEEEKALADLGVCINVMPYKFFHKLGLGELRPTQMTLQLADQSIRYPWGIVEDDLVKVGKYIFLADFVVLDVDEDVVVRLILG